MPDAYVRFVLLCKTLNSPLKIFTFLAFSWFSTCEYVIATCNMAFHSTVVLDFPEELFAVGQSGPEVQKKKD